MLRITLEPSDLETRAVVIRLDGQVTGAWVDELRKACDDAAGRNGDRRVLLLDLSGVTLLGPDGIELVRELRARGTRLAHASAFVTEQLRGSVDVDG